MSTGRIFFVACAVVSCGVAACSSSSGGGVRPDGGGSGGGTSSGGASATGGASSGSGGAASGGAAATGGASSGSGGAVVCGGEACKTTSDGTGVDAHPCCTADGACGVKLPISVACLPRNQFGTVNQFCDSYDLPGPITLPGCCGSDGCGARTTIENLGCISNAHLGRAKVACNQSGEPVDGG